MGQEKYKFRMYERLATEAPQILNEAREAALDLGLADTLRTHRPMADQDGDSDNILCMVTEIREIVKDAFGDAYDACPVVSASAGLALCRRVVIPLRSGQHHSDQPVILAPRMKPSEFLAGCLAAPPKYRILPEFSTLGSREDTQGLASSQVLSAEAVYQRTQGLAAAIVPLVGATYDYHGIMPGQVPMIANAIPDASLESAAATANAYMPWLAAVFAMGTAIPGCGFSTANGDGMPKVHSGLGELASEFDVPFIVDNSTGIPFLGPDPSKISVSAVTYGPYGPGFTGLVVGTEEVIIPLLKAAGIGKGWTGAPTGPANESGGSSLGPMLGVQADIHVGLSTVLPAPEELRRLLALLREVRENPERYTRLVSKMYDTVTAEFAQFKDEFKTILRFQKNYAALSVEVNYEDTWNKGLGFPVFSVEDELSGKHLLREGLKAMGITHVSVLDASLMIGPPKKALMDSPTVSVDHDRLRLEVQGLVALLKIIGKHAGYTM